MNRGCAIGVLQPRNFIGVFAPGKLVSRGTGTLGYVREPACSGAWYAPRTSSETMRFRFMLIALAVAALYVFATRNPFA